MFRSTASTDEGDFGVSTSYESEFSSTKKKPQQYLKVEQQKEGKLAKKEEQTLELRISEEGNYKVVLRNTSGMPVPGGLAFSASVSVYSKSQMDQQSPSSSAPKKSGSVRFIKSIHKSRTDTVHTGQQWETSFPVFREETEEVPSSEFTLEDFLPVTVVLKLQSQAGLGLKDVYYEAVLMSEYDLEFQTSAVVQYNDKPTIERGLGPGLYRLFIENTSPLPIQQFYHKTSSSLFTSEAVVLKAHVYSSQYFTVFGKQAPLVLVTEFELRPATKICKQALFQYSLTKVWGSDTEILKYEEIIQFAKELAILVAQEDVDAIYSKIQYAKQKQFARSIRDYKHKFTSSNQQEDAEEIFKRAMKVLQVREELADAITILVKSITQQELIFLKNDATDITHLKQLLDTLLPKVQEVQSRFEEKTMGYKLFLVTQEAAKLVQRLKNQEEFRLRIRQFVDLEHVLEISHKMSLLELLGRLEPLFSVELPTATVTSSVSEGEEEEHLEQILMLLKHERATYKQMILQFLEKLDQIEIQLATLQSLLQQNQRVPLAEFLESQKSLIGHLAEFKQAVNVVEELARREKEEAEQAERKRLEQIALEIQRKEQEAEEERRKVELRIQEQLEKTRLSEQEAAKAATTKRRKSIRWQDEEIVPTVEIVEASIQEASITDIANSLSTRNLLSELRSSMLQLVQKIQATQTGQGKIIIHTQDYAYKDEMKKILCCLAVLLTRSRAKVTNLLTLSSKEKLVWDIIRKVNKSTESFVVDFLSSPAFVQFQKITNNELEVASFFVQKGLEEKCIILEAIRGLLSQKCISLLNSSYNTDSLLRDASERDTLNAVLDLFHQFQFEKGSSVVVSSVSNNATTITQSAISDVPVQPMSPQNTNVVASDDLKTQESLISLVENNGSHHSENHTRLLQKVAEHAKASVSYFIQNKAESKRDLGDELMNPEITTIVRDSFLKGSFIPALQDGLLQQLSLWNAVQACSEKNPIFSKLSNPMSKLQLSDEQRSMLFLVACINSKKLDLFVKTFAYDEDCLQQFYSEGALVRERQAVVKLYKYTVTLSKLPIQLIPS